MRLQLRRVDLRGRRARALRLGRALREEPVLLSALRVEGAGLVPQRLRVVLAQLREREVLTRF